jgi:hypothetical protein
MRPAKMGINATTVASFGAGRARFGAPAPRSAKFIAATVANVDPASGTWKFNGAGTRFAKHSDKAAALIKSS